VDEIVYFRAQLSGDFRSADVGGEIKIDVDVTLTFEDAPLRDANLLPKI
jgi:hypothetical protein